MLESSSDSAAIAVADPTLKTIAEMNANPLREQSPDKPLRLHNVVCPYCGVALTKENTTKEHVIGRKFVPKGTLENQWNLILNACRPCNNEKSNLEDDISAISMQPSVSGNHFSDHPQLAVDAVRKRKKTLSRHTGKVVGESTTSTTIEGQLAPGLTATFKMRGQAQVAPDRLFELARLQSQAFFFLITYDHSENRGYWWKGKFAPVQAVSRLDWGNERAVTFMSETQSWDPRLLGHVAEGHFRIVIKKHPQNDIWSLALEWNGNFRVMAVCGDEEPLKDFLDRMPILKMHTISQTQDRVVRFRAEKSLAPDCDILFKIADDTGHVLAR